MDPISLFITSIFLDWLIPGEKQDPDQEEDTMLENLMYKNEASGNLKRKPKLSNRTGSSTTRRKG